jgi:hypothetical protein
MSKKVEEARGYIVDTKIQLSKEDITVKLEALILSLKLSTDRSAEIELAIQKLQEAKFWIIQHRLGD